MKKVKVNAELYVGNNKLATIQEVNDIVNDNIREEPKREIEFITENNVIKWRYKDESEFNVLLDASFINDSKPNYVTPEMYGAKGDGVTDDKMAFMEALKQDLPIVLGNKKYLISELLLGDCIIEGQTSNSTLIVKHSLKCKSNILLKNMIIEMPNDKTSESVIKTFKSSCNIKLENIKFTGKANLEEIKITGYEFIKLTNEKINGFSSNDIRNTEFHIKNCEFYESNSTTICAYGAHDDVIIDDCIFHKKTTETNSIMMFGMLPSKHCEITNNTFENFSRMPIEIAVYDGLIITGNTFGEDISLENPNGTNRYYYIASLPGCSNIEVSNNKGNNCCGFELGSTFVGNNGNNPFVMSKNISIHDNDFTFKNGAIVVNGGNGEIRDIRIYNNYLKHLNPPHKSMGYVQTPLMDNIYDMRIENNTIVDCGIISLGDHNNSFIGNTVIRTSLIAKPLLELHGDGCIVEKNAFITKDVDESSLPSRGDCPYMVAIKKDNTKDIKILNNTFLGSNYCFGFIGTWDDRTQFTNPESIIIQGNKMSGCIQDKNICSILMPENIVFLDNIVDNNISVIAPESARISQRKSIYSYLTEQEMKSDMYARLYSICDVQETGSRYLIKQSAESSEISIKLNNGFYAVLINTQSSLVCNSENIKTGNVYSKLVLCGENESFAITDASDNIEYSITNVKTDEKTVTVKGNSYSIPQMSYGVIKIVDGNVFSTFNKK